VTIVLAALNSLQPHHVPALAEQLGKFPALKQVDASANPGMRCTGAAIILSALSGMIPLAGHCLLLIVSCDC
jgi:hypothetical protein